MTDKEIIYRLALQRVSGIGALRSKRLINHLGSAKAVFETKDQPEIERMGSVHWTAIKKYKQFNDCEEELSFIRKNNIQFLAFDQDNYPSKLKRAVDAPAFLFYKGDTSLHNTRVISIIGTRACSEYGKLVCAQIIEGLAAYNPLIVSGLAYGIDIVAHRAALQSNLSTVGVMATGLDSIYPSQHKNTANEMLACGGLLTEFLSKTKPDRENFPSRNRLVAGIADAVVVIETAKKGGSMITAQLADSYNRDVFCVPGKVGDKRSEGCNFLIKSLKANLITSAADIAYNLNWEKEASQSEVQRKLFVELSEEERLVYDKLQEGLNVHIDDLFLKTQLPMSRLSTLLLQLEMTGMVCSLPGKQYRAT